MNGDPADAGHVQARIANGPDHGEDADHRADAALDAKGSVAGHLGLGRSVQDGKHTCEVVRAVGHAEHQVQEIHGLIKVRRLQPGDDGLAHWGATAAGQLASTVIEMPPRGLKTPSTRARRGRMALTISSRMRLTAASWNVL